MGRINEYQRQRLASAAVGTTQPSRAGQIIGQAVADLGTVVRGREKERARQDDVFSDLRANNHLMDYVTGLRKVTQALQTEYAADPGQVPTKLQEEGAKLLEEIAGNITDDQVMSKFVSSATTALRGVSLQTVEWKFDKQEENAIIDTFESLEKATMEAGGTPNVEGLESSFNMIQETLRNIPTQGDEKESPVPTTGLPQDKVKMLEDEARARALRLHLTRRIEMEPFRVGSDIEQGIYDNLTVNVEKRVGDKTKKVPVKIPFTAEMKKEFMKKAQSELSVQNYKKKVAETMRFTGTALEWANAVSEGEASLVDLQREVSRANADPNASPEYRKNMETLLSSRMSLLAHTVRQDDNRVTTEIDTKHAQLELEIAGVNKKIREGRIRLAKRQAAELATDLLKLQTEVHDFHARGLITRSTRDGFIKEIQPTMLRGILAQTEYPKEGFIGFRTYRDTYGQYYETMNRQINDIPNISDDEKNFAIVRAARFFIEEVMSARAQSPNQEVTEAQYLRAQKEAVSHIKQLYDPSYELYAVGEVTPDGKVVGYSERGAPLFELPDETINAIREGTN